LGVASSTHVIEERPKQGKEQKAEPRSAYEDCVLRESSKIHELIAEGG